MQINQGSISAGEKQLLALARATLRRTNIIILDEATSQIDSNLDDQVCYLSLGLFDCFSSFDIFQKIQRTIREELANAIVITIAHRLKTVMDYDRILVLDEGRIVEFDTPSVLLQTPNSAFREMCRNSADWPLFLQMSQDKSGFSV
jgi:ABC-type multidrug transport system fused ATPase/permease subunit